MMLLSYNTSAVCVGTFGGCYTNFGPLYVFISTKDSALMFTGYARNVICLSLDSDQR